MNMMNINNRLLKEGDKINLDNLYDIDFDDVKTRLEVQIESSIEYLIKSLK